MKKVICIILSFLFVLPLAACGSSLKMTIGKFMEKYHHADLDEICEDPTEFLKDYDAATWYQAPREEINSTFIGWTKDDTLSDYGDEYYRKNTVLLNIPVEIRGSVYYNSYDTESNRLAFYISFESPKTEDNFKFAQSICEYCFKRESIKEARISGRDADEYDLRSLFISGEYKYFTVEFETVHVTFFYAEYSQTSYVSIYTYEAE